MSWFKRGTCSHEYYLDDLHRFDDGHVVGLCHKCKKPQVASCGPDLPGKLIGYRKMNCPTCNGEGVVPDRRTEQSAGGGS